MGGCRGAFRAWSHWCGGRRWARRRPEHQRSTPSTARLEDAAGPAGPGRASRRRAEPKARGADGERAGRPRGGRRSGGRPGPKAPGTPAEHTKYRPMGGCRNPAGVEGAGGSGCGARGRQQGQAKYMHTKYRPIGGRRGACRAWPGFEPKARGADGERAGRPRGDRNSHSWLDPKVPQARMSSTHSLVTRNKMRKRASERESEFLEACLRTGKRVP